MPQYRGIAVGRAVQRCNQPERERGQPELVVPQRVVPDQVSRREVPGRADRFQRPVQRAGGLEVDQPRPVVVIDEHVVRIDVDERVPGVVQPLQDNVQRVDDPLCPLVVGGEVGRRGDRADERVVLDHPGVQRATGDELGDEELVLPLLEVVQRLGAASRVPFVQGA